MDTVHHEMDPVATRGGPGPQRATVAHNAGCCREQLSQEVATTSAAQNAKISFGGSGRATPPKC
eukprot:8262840-Alexandrium_andersonii.AAC.1